MKAVSISLLRVGVALGAANLLWRGLVNQAFHVFVAIHTGKEIAVNRVLQLAFIHIQANLLAVDLSGQGRVAVASKTLAILGLMLSTSRTRPPKQGQNDKPDENCAASIEN
jgi:hypothetical protein